ncbi:MAG: hypothetical protein SGPRY_008397, partial [Prymnesium sp.]
PFAQLSSIPLETRRTCGMSGVVQLSVPPGVGPGDTLLFDYEGTQMSTVVPNGVSEGMDFHVEVESAAGLGSTDRKEGGKASEEAGAPAGPQEQMQQYMDGRAASGDIMDQFASWMERENVEEAYEAFIEANASKMQGSNGAEGEQDHSWWPLYQVLT